jgi:integrase
VTLTGERAGELERTDIGDLKTLHSYLTVRGTKSRRSKDRRVDYSAALTDRLRPYLDSHPRSLDPTAPLFYGRDNNSRPDPFRRFDPGTFYKRVFKPAAIKLGLPALRFHDLRHTAGSWWIEAGVSLETVSARLGHADINFTRKTYIHQLHTRVEEDAQKVDTWLTANLKQQTNVIPLRPTGTERN